MKKVIIFSTLLFGIFIIAKQTSNANKEIQPANISQVYNAANLPLTNFKTSKCKAGGMSYSYDDMINKIMGKA